MEDYANFDIAGSFVHFYWAGGYPPYSTVKNINSWSSHLKDTEFVSILWCNSSTYSAIKKEGYADIGSVDFIMKFYATHKHQTLKTLKAGLPNSHMNVMYFGTRRYIDLQGIKHAKPMNVLVIDYELFFTTSIKKALHATYKNSLILLKATAKKLNEYGLFQFVKDQLSITFLAHFGGFYFDSDIPPNKSVSFFNSIQELEFVDDLSSTDASTRVYPLIRFTNPKLSPADQLRANEKMHLGDMGFLFCFKPSPLKESLESINYTHFQCLYKINIEPYIFKFKEAQKEKKADLSGAYAWITSPLMEKTTASQDLSKYYMQLYKNNRDEFAKQVHNAVVSFYRNPVVREFFSNVITPFKSLERALHTKQIRRYAPCIGAAKNNEKVALEKYRDFYIKFFYDKFPQQPMYYSTSIAKTGFQELERYYNATQVISETILDNAKRLIDTYG